MSKGDGDPILDPARIGEIHNLAARAGEAAVNSQPVSPIEEPKSRRARPSEMRRNKQAIRRIRAAEWEGAEPKADKRGEHSRIYAISALAGAVVVSALTAYATIKVNSEHIPEAAGVVAASAMLYLGTKFGPGSAKNKIIYVSAAALIAGGVVYGALEPDSVPDAPANNTDEPAFVGGGLVCDKETETTMLRTPWDTWEAYMGTRDPATIQAAGAQLAANNPEFNPSTVPVDGLIPTFKDCYPALSPPTQP